MKNKILITSFDMEIGGIERILSSMSEYLDYQNTSRDLQDQLKQYVLDCENCNIAEHITLYKVC
jgi:hypothetical protein